MRGNIAPSVSQIQPRSGEILQPTAQAVGDLTNPAAGPGGGERKLIPNIFLVVRNAIFLEEDQELVSKRMLLVVLFLQRNVSSHGRNVGFAYAENAITRLPGKIGAPFFVNPTGGIRLDHASDFCRGMSGTNPQQHVDVIGGAIAVPLMISAAPCISRMMPPR